MIRAAIVGMGRWGRVLVDSVSGDGGGDAIRFVAGTTRTASKAEDYAAERGLRLHAKLDELLADDDIDAVVLASPHTAHHGQIMAAARAGKHVYCEKPFCLRSADAASALEALAARGLKVAIGHNRRFFPNAIALKRMIDAGELGEMVHIEGNFSSDLTGYAGAWRASRAESPAGGMTSLGIHVVDMFLNLFGPIEHVRATSRRVAMPLDIDDATAVLVRFEGGQLGYLGTVASTAPLWRLRVFGTRGWAEVAGYDRMTVRKAGEESRTATWEECDYPYPPSVAAALEAFARHCEGGDPFPVTPGQILHATRVLEAIVESAAAGRGVWIRGGD